METIHWVLSNPSSAASKASLRLFDCSTANRKVQTVLCSHISTAPFTVAWCFVALSFDAGNCGKHWSAFLCCILIAAETPSCTENSIWLRDFLKCTCSSWLAPVQSSVRGLAQIISLPSAPRLGSALAWWPWRGRNLF